MALKEHPDYREEKDRLKYTIEYVKNAIKAADENRKRFREDMREAFIELDPTDSSLSYSRIMLNAKFLDSLEKNYDGLVKAQKKPYFCRIDFKPEGSTKVNKLYIGKTSLSRAEDDAPLIVDWRSPIASVYYDGRLGRVSYNTPQGEASGELYLKRQYTINNGRLENIMDVDITTTDAFLQAALGENKDSRLKDIVSTIQAEQNEIIRADIDSPLIVQGAAGSGKTTIALHRIAYLIYTYEETFDPDNFLIIAPNRLFLNYISEVLPELGVEQVKQTTFVDLVNELSGIKYKLADTDKKIEMFLELGNRQDEGELQLLGKGSEFKGSLEFRDIIDRYVDYIEQCFCPDKDFCLEEYTIYSADEIKKMFLTDFSYLPLYKRIKEMKKALSNKLKRDKLYIIEEVEEYYDKQINHLRDTMAESEERRLRLVALMDERDKKVQSLKKTARTAVVKFLSLFPKHDVIHYYRELITDPENLVRFGNGVLEDEVISYICSHTSTILRKKTIEYEDLTPLLYLKYRIFGLEKDMKIKYMVIDEAQDFSLFQLYALKEIFNTELFTILGDLAQGIHSYRGIKDWGDVLNKVFTSSKRKYLTLEQSYRTTVEIMNAANEVLKMANISEFILAKPVVRHGDKPRIYRFGSKTKLAEALIKKVTELKNEGYNTIAIICKTVKECTKIKKLLDESGKVNAKQLSADDITYEGGIVVVPSYFAKGLEFDVVVITAVEEDYHEKELDLKLLYVGMTRALHSMDVMCLDKNMELLKKVDSNRFKTIKEAVGLEHI